MVGRKLVLGMLALMLCVAILPSTAQERRVLNIYSARHYGAIEAPFNQFTADTGIEIRVSQGSSQALLERLRAEGPFSPADLYLSIDAGTMLLAAAEGLLQPIDTSIVKGQLDEGMFDPDGQWFALSKRLRTIMYNPETVDPAMLVDYSSLADPAFRDRLCLRPGSHVYTISLISGLIHNLGEEEAERIVAGWVANNPRYIDSDTRILETIEAGGCDVGITNHYYLARKLNENPEFPVQMQVVGQGEGETGVLFNVQIVGVTAAAVNVDEAIEFIRYFSSVEGQGGAPENFPGSNFEYPTNSAAELNEIVAGFGEIRFDTQFPLARFGEFQPAAVDLINRVGYGMREN